MTERERIVNRVRGWIGYSESNGKHKIIVNTYNNIKPLPVGYKLKPNDAWCAATVSAAAWEEGLTNIVFPECSCPRMITLFQKNNAWNENDNYKPLPGDIIFYDWEDSGVGDNQGSADHVGIVEEVKGNMITVIEGNISNAVGRRTLQIGAKGIRGYGVPKYKENATDATTEALNTLSKAGEITSPVYWETRIKTQTIDPMFWDNLGFLIQKYAKKCN